MRRRAAVLLIATLTAGMLVVGAAADAGAQGGKAPKCKGKTKAAAIEAIEEAYFKFLDGASSPTFEDKAPYIQYMGPPVQSPALIALYQESSAANEAAAATTSVQVNEVTCTGKKTADVLYDLVLGGEPAPGIAPPGSAILEKGSKQWKVTAQAFCDLTALGNASVLESGPCSEILSGSDPSDLEDA
ncbi:MAG: hypothetical protein FJW86_14155 [Actinobacteria bacterium]|nr:hypothetical protein [Actinomycetota bacterium]